MYFDDERVRWSRLEGKKAAIFRGLGESFRDEEVTSFEGTVLCFPPGNACTFRMSVTIYYVYEFAGTDPDDESTAVFEYVRTESKEAGGFN